MWTPDGVVLIDPAAHAGHRESDLAMLALFGCPHYDAIIAGYQRVRPLKPDWRKRIGLAPALPAAGACRAVRRRARGADARAAAARRAGRAALVSKRDDDRRVDAAPDAALPRQRHVRVAAPLDRRHDPGAEASPIEATVAAMDAAGVDLGLLSAWHGPGGQDLISNDEVAGWVAAHPDRFAGLATVDLDRPMAAVRELRRCVEELGFVGLRVLPWLWEAPPTDRRYYPLYADCVELGRSVLHPGRPHRAAAPVRDRAPDPLHRPGRARLPGAGDRLRPRRLPVDRGDGRGRAQARERLHRHLGLHQPARYPTELVAYMKTAHAAGARCCSAPTTR